MTTFSSADKQQLETLGISAQQVENQIVQFKNGFAFSDLIAPATIGKGIVRFNENEIKDLVRQFDEDKKYYDIIKFVPEKTGAAGRLGVWRGGLGCGVSVSSLPDDVRF